MPHILRQEGQHRKAEGLEFWAEDGIVYIEDTIDGDYKVVTCTEFAHRAKALNREAHKATYPSDAKKLNNLVLLMYDVWKEAKAQGDPSDIEIARQKYRERRKSAAIITGDW